MNISLTNDLHNFVRQKVDSGEFPSEEAVLQEAVRRFRQADQDGDHADTPEKATLPELIDWEAIESCAREVEGKNIPSHRRGPPDARQDPWLNGPGRH